MTVTDILLQAVQALEPTIRQYAADAERDCKMSKAVATAMQQAGLYRILRPKAYGGFELDPVSALRIIEAVSRIDSAAGWNLQIAVAHDMFAPWFGEQAAAEIFHADAITVGAFNPPRQAVAVEGGYRISGRTGYVSGAHHATAFLGFALLSGDSEAKPWLIAVPAEQAQIIDNWNVMGMRGSGSHDVEFSYAFIPEHWAVPWRPLETVSPAYAGPLYRLTVWPAIAVLVAPALGVARAAINEAIDLFKAKTPAFGGKALKDSSVVQAKLAGAEAKLEASRAFLFTVFDEAYQTACADQPITLAMKGRMQLAMTHTTQECAQAVSLIQDIAGASAIREDYGFARHFRDIHVIAQHGFANAAKLESIGQILLGLEPEWPFFKY